MRPSFIKSQQFRGSLNLNHIHCSKQYLKGSGMKSLVLTVSKKQIVQVSYVSRVYFQGPL